MGWTDLIRFAAQNLWRRRARTLLTTLGVVIGTVCIILLFALGLSSYKQFEEEIMSSDTLTQITVSGNMSENGSMTKIDESTLASMKAIEGVDAVTPVIQLPIFVDAGDYEANLYVTAMDTAFISESLEFNVGGMFTDSEMPQIVVGYYTQAEFVKPGEQPDYDAIYNYYGDEEKQEPDITLPFDFKTQQLKAYLGSSPDQSYYGDDTPASRRYPAAIIGTLKKTQNQQDQAYMSLSAAKRMLQQNRKLAKQMGIETDNFNEVRIRAKDVDSVSDIVDMLNKMGYQAWGEGTILESIQEQRASQQSQLVFIGAIALFVSAIGIANTMLTSILERRREIGIMKVTGLAMKKIRRMFLIEAAVIGLAGGAIGAFLSYIIAFTVNTGTGNTEILGMYFQQGMVLTIPLWLTLAGIGVAVFVGLVAGIYPAWKATKLSPMEAIRGN